jgi:protein-disulfide isomerase
MKKALEAVATVTVVTCALIVTGLLLRREFFAPSPSLASPPQQPVFIKDWRVDLSTRVRLGTSDAAVQIAEFADFECPFCGELHKTLKEVERHYPRQIGLAYIHFPIPGHRFAIPAARAAECAGEQGRFEPMHDQLFEHQEDFGLKPWSEFATAAGVPDLGAFAACVKKTDPVPGMEDGKELGKKLNVQGTPTVIINGWKLGRPPTEEELDGMVKKVLAGKSPVGST